MHADSLTDTTEFPLRFDGRQCLPLPSRDLHCIALHRISHFSAYGFATREI